METKQKFVSEIKKLLYRNKPIAHFYGEYDTYKEWEVVTEGFKISFHVPLDEAVGIESDCPAQLLIRWMFNVYFYINED